jgi:hypothetical protein
MVERARRFAQRPRSFAALLLGATALAAAAVLALGASGPVPQGAAAPLGRGVGGS